jgi:galactitol-specific phosphotransferase system IIB component
MEKKLILVICGAGINTSTAAKDFIMDELERRRVDNVEVKHTLISDAEKYRNRKNMVIVCMTKADVIDFDVPVFQGLNFLIGTRKTKQELVDKIQAALDEISQ